MAIAHRHRYASFTTPKQVPLEPVEVDWNHPLANRLVSCYIPGGTSGYRDITGLGATLTPQSATAIVAGALGPGVNQSTTPCQIYATAAAAQRIPNTAPGATVFWYGQQSGSYPNNVQLAGVAYNATNSSPYFSYGIWQGTTGEVIAGCSGYNGTATETPAPALPSIFSAAAIFSVGGNCQAFVNGGNPSPTASIGSTPFLYAANAPVVIGCSPGTGHASFTTTFVELIYARPLSAQEIQWLHNEPFAMLRPVQRKIRAMVVASSGGTQIPQVPSMEISFATQHYLAIMRTRASRMKASRQAE